MGRPGPAAGSAAPLTRAGSPPPRSAAAQENLVQTQAGAVRGVIYNEARAFLGVPYAEPPVGPRRPKAAWYPAVFNASTQPPGCPQHCDLPPHTCPPSLSEDCLYLNVYTPRLRNQGLRGPGAEGNSPWPVMLFIHGGRFEQGGIDTSLYDARFLAGKYGVMVVTIQYRLGALGFLTTSSLGGNYAIQDQREAMRWVRQNAAAFGGDPGRVTIFGQSAGAMSVATHLVSPWSQGLFHGAMMESDPLPLRYKSVKEASGLGSRFADKVGCSKAANETACMRGKTAEEVVAAQREAQGHLDLKHPLELFVPWVPTLSDEVPRIPMDAFTAGVWNRVPLVIGSVLNDARMFIWEAWSSKLGGLEYRAVVSAIFGLSHESHMLELYPTQDDNRIPLAHLGTDFLFYCAARSVGEHGGANASSPVYQYRFDHALSFNGAWGPNYTFCDGYVCHASELPFVFDSATLAGFKPTAEEEVLAKSVMGYWTQFAKTGSPNGLGLPEWRPTAPGAPWEMRLDTPACSGKAGLEKKECDYYDSIGYSHG